MREYIKDDMGKRIASLRREHQMTQTELAEKLYVSLNSVNRWEHGTTLIDCEALSKLSECFNVSADWLLTGIGTKDLLFCNQTGLSAEAVKELERLPFLSSALNELLISPTGVGLLVQLCNILNGWGLYEDFYTEDGTKISSTKAQILRILDLITSIQHFEDMKAREEHEKET